jgi:subtilisin-like proprotein convertase family protein
MRNLLPSPARFHLGRFGLGLLIAGLCAARPADLQAQDYYSYGGAIADAGAGNAPVTTTFTQSVGAVGTLTGTNRLTRVCLSITHPRPNDLDIFLVSPAGTTIRLSDENGGSSGNDYHEGLCFSECGPNGSIIGLQDYRGSYLPEQPLSNINNGQNGNGTWQLQVVDDATGTIGTLNYWSLDFGTTAAIASPSGETCASAIPLSLPFDHACLSLAGKASNYNSASLCNGHFQGSEILYSYTPTTANEYLSIDIAQDFSAPSGFPTVSLLDACPEVAVAANCIQTEIQFSASENILHITSVPLVQGTPYYIVVASTSGVGGTYDLRVAMGRNGSSNCFQATPIDHVGEYAGNNVNAPQPNTQAPGGEMACNGSRDNFIYYTFTTDATGGTVHANLTDIDCGLSCGGACGVQVALFQVPAGGPCLGPGTWGAPIACESSTLLNSYYTWNGLLPNTQYYLMVDGTAGSQCVWNLHMSGNFLQTPLPMRLDNFQVVQAGAYNRIAWTTGMEENLDRIEVQHTTTLPEFSTLATVDARGALQRSQDYHIDHAHPAWGWHYYRLTAIDRNGAENHSSIASIYIEGDEDSFSIAPNPAQDRLQVQTRIAGSHTLRILGTEGRVWQTQAWEGNGDLQIRPLDISKLRPGFYLVELRTPQGKPQTIRLVKQ